MPSPRDINYQPTAPQGAQRSVSPRSARPSAGTRPNRATKHPGLQSPSPAARPSVRSNSTKKNLPLLPIAIAILVVAVVGFVTYNLVNYMLKEAAAPKAARVSLVAVGDNLIDIGLSEFADAADGSAGDGHYDYTALYRPIEDILKSADISYINQEVHLGGDEIGPRGYPSFNCMEDMADCLVATGFDFVASATNHSYDWGLSALTHSCEVFAQKDVAFTGTATSPENAAKIATLERNGITFALLNYTYGVNGYDESEIPSYAVNFYHEDRIANDVAAAKEVADVVMVAMHWGTELQTEENEEQQAYAQLLADLGVDVILGSHPHCIQPMKWIQGKDGNNTLCVYSMGNFVSNHESPGLLPTLEGMVSLDFVRDKGESTIRIENVVWTPLVSYRYDTEAGRQFGVYKLADLTDEMVRSSFDANGEDVGVQWYKDKTNEVIGSDFAIDM